MAKIDSIGKDRAYAPSTVAEGAVRAVIMPPLLQLTPSRKHWPMLELKSLFGPDGVGPGLLLSKPQLSVLDPANIILTRMAQWFNAACGSHAAAVTSVESPFGISAVDDEDNLKAHFLREADSRPTGEIIWVHTHKLSGRAAARAAKTGQALTPRLRSAHPIAAAPVAINHTRLNIFEKTQGRKWRSDHAFVPRAPIPSVVFADPDYAASWIRMRAVREARPPIALEASKAMWPLSVLAGFIRALTAPGDWVLDPAATFPDVAVAALLAGRSYVGMRHRANEHKPLPFRELIGDMLENRELYGWGDTDIAAQVDYELYIAGEKAHV